MDQVSCEGMRGVAAGLPDAKKGIVLFVFVVLWILLGDDFGLWLILWGFSGVFGLLEAGKYVLRGDRVLNRFILSFGVKNE